MSRTTNCINVVVELLREYMELPREQVVLYNQSWKVPVDERLYISVGLLNSRPYSSTREYENNPDHSALLEVVTLYRQEVYSINIYSYGQEAINRKEEVLMALNSTLAQQVSEKHSFKFASIPVAFTDVSAVEGAARLSRYNLTVAALCASRKERIVQYYDKFDNSPALIVNP